MIKLIIITICLILVISHEVKVKPQIGCALSPFGKLPKGQVSNINTDIGWTFNCSSHLCQEVHVPSNVNGTTNFFASKDECDSTCPRKLFNIILN